MTVEPVVVKPDIDSKKASVIDSLLRENTNGRAPAATTASHASVVNMKPWATSRLKLSPRFASASEPPKKTVAIPAATKVRQSELATFRSARARTSMTPPRPIRSRPIT